MQSSSRAPGVFPPLVLEGELKRTRLENSPRLSKLLGARGTVEADVVATLKDGMVDGKLDLDGSILREMEEETGLGAAHLLPSDQRWISWDGPLFCCARRLDTALTALEAGELAAKHLASQKRPELARIVFVKSLDDIEGLKVPAYAEALLRQVLV